MRRGFLCARRKYPLTRIRGRRTVCGMTIREAAETLGLKQSTLRLQIKLRKLKAHKMGATWYVNPAEVERYARENRRQPKEGTA